MPAILLMRPGSDSTCLVPIVNYRRQDLLGGLWRHVAPCLTQSAMFSAASLTSSHT